MGGSSSSAATTQNSDKRLAVAEGALGVSGDNNSTSMVVNSIDGGALKVSGEALTTAMKATEAAAQQAIDWSGQVVRDSLALSSQNTSQTLSAITSVNRDALAFADHLSMGALELSVKSQGMMADSFAQDLGFAEHIVDMSMKNNDMAQQASQGAIAQVARAYDTATNYQAEKATTDSRYLVVAGIVAVAIVASKALK